MLIVAEKEKCVHVHASARSSLMPHAGVYGVRVPSAINRSNGLREAAGLDSAARPRHSDGKLISG